MCLCTRVCENWAIQLLSNDTDGLLSPSPFFLTKSSVSTKSHQLSQWPPDNIQAPRDLLHARNIHADPDKPTADSNKPLNQPLKQNLSERPDKISHCTQVCVKTEECYSYWNKTLNCCSLDVITCCENVMLYAVPKLISQFLLSYLLAKDLVAVLTWTDNELHVKMSKYGISLWENSNCTIHPFIHPLLPRLVC